MTDQLLIDTGDGWRPLTGVLPDGFTITRSPVDAVTFDYSASISVPPSISADTLTQQLALSRVRSSAIAAWNEAQR